MSSSVVYRKEFIFDIDSKKIRNDVNQWKNIYDKNENAILQQLTNWYYMALIREGGRTVGSGRVATIIE